MQIKGNAMASGDGALDREQEDWIRRQLRAGNRWARCCAKVTATFELGGVTFSGVAYLGCCSYLSEEDFKQSDGYYPQMCDEAREDMIATLHYAIKYGIKAKQALEVLS